MSALLSKLVLGREHIHVHENRGLPPNRFRDEAGVEVLADAARAHRDEGAHDADASQRQAYCSELALQGGRVVKGRVVRRGLQHPILVSGHDIVAGGGVVWLTA